MEKESMKKKMKITFLAMILMSTALAACAASASADLTGSWELVKFEGHANLSSVNIVFEGGQVAGRGGCNNFKGEYSLQGNKITFGPLASTMMACEEPFMNLESAFHAALGQADGFSVAGDQLTITYPGGEMVFSRMAQ